MTTPTEALSLAREALAAAIDATTKRTSGIARTDWLPGAMSVLSEIDALAQPSAPSAEPAAHQTFLDQIDAETEARQWLDAMVPKDKHRAFWQWEAFSFSPHDGRVYLIRERDKPVAAALIVRNGLNRTQLLKWSAPTAPAPLPADTLSQQLQQRCVEWGVYWRASDAHGVDLSHDQALELLRDALGVEVEIAAPLMANGLTEGEALRLAEALESCRSPHLYVNQAAAELRRLAALAAPQAATASVAGLTYEQWCADWVQRVGYPPTMRDAWAATSPAAPVPTVQPMTDEEMAGGLQEHGFLAYGPPCELFEAGARWAEKNRAAAWGITLAGIPAAPTKE